MKLVLHNVDSFHVGNGGRCLEFYKENCRKYFSFPSFPKKSKTQKKQKYHMKSHEDP